MTRESQRQTLYPEIEPYNCGYLKVSELHTIYYEECGNPNGKPALLLHGGPGGGSSPKMRRFHDPQKYRIILFDQRGCGKSTPRASLQENTTWHLVEDIETLRNFLQISSWQVFGGSWGSTLAMAYAQTHPSKVSEIILRGIFMLRKKEIKWFYQEGASFIFPDAWEYYLEPIPNDERHNLLDAYYKRLSSSDLSECIPFAKAWSIWEGRTSNLIPREILENKYGNDDFALSFARIECHYFKHGGYFDTDNQLLENVDTIRHIPAVIVQGRYDVVCPVQTAWELHRAWPQAKFCMVPDAGHSAFEAGIAHELVLATSSFAH